jgi:putative thiamine transport system permease protein
MLVNVKRAWALAAVILFVLPLLASLGLALQSALRLTAWNDLLQYPQLWSALWLSLATGAASTALALSAAVLTVIGLYDHKSWHSLPVKMGAMLAVPHLAMAVGLGFLIMPSGVIARILALVLGWHVPPQWVSVHDPFGIALVAALALKETPFLIWVFVTLLNREDIKHNFFKLRAAAFSLGHGTGSLWLRIYLPQLFGNMIWPLVIVFVYAATVVDMSLAIGPTQPPTLATIIWADINSEQVVHNARGAAGALFLSMSLGLALLLLWALAKWAKPHWRKFLTHGPSTWQAPVCAGRTKARAFNGIYVGLLALLLFMSVAQSWPFPQLWPQASTKSWARIANEPQALATSIMLAFSTSVTALVILLGWFEAMPAKADRLLLGSALALLGLPAIFVGLGQYQVFLQLGLTGTWAGLFLAHLMPVTAYMMIVLAQTYRSFDLRYQATAKSLQAKPLSFLWQVKWPLLKAPLWAALAVGFAVSFGQYIPAQLVAAGRYSTLPMEVVTLTSGTNRPLLAAFTLLLMLPPLIIYVASAMLGRPRWRNL